MDILMAVTILRIMYFCYVDIYPLDSNFTNLWFSVYHPAVKLGVNTANGLNPVVVEVRC